MTSDPLEERFGNLDDLAAELGRPPRPLPRRRARRYGPESISAHCRILIGRDAQPDTQQPAA